MWADVSTVLCGGPLCRDPAGQKEIQPVPLTGPGIAVVQITGCHFLYRLFRQNRLVKVNREFHNPFPFIMAGR